MRCGVRGAVERGATAHTEIGDLPPGLGEQAVQRSDRCQPCALEEELGAGGDIRVDWFGNAVGVGEGCQVVVELPRSVQAVAEPVVWGIGMGLLHVMDVSHEALVEEPRFSVGSESHEFARPPAHSQS